MSWLHGHKTNVYTSKQSRVSRNIMYVYVIHEPSQTYQLTKNTAAYTQLPSGYKNTNTPTLYVYASSRDSELALHSQAVKDRLFGKCLRRTLVVLYKRTGMYCGSILIERRSDIGQYHSPACLARPQNHYSYAEKYLLHIPLAVICHDALSTLFCSQNCIAIQHHAWASRNLNAAPALSETACGRDSGHRSHLCLFERC